MKKRITVGMSTVMFTALSASQAFAKQCPFHMHEAGAMASGPGLAQYFSLGLMFALLMGIAVLKVLYENESKLPKGASAQGRVESQDPARVICRNLNFGENFAYWSHLKKMAQTHRTVS